MVNRATNPSRVAWGHLFVLLLVLPTGPAALGDGLIIDEDVLQLMTEQPDAEHSLILTVALTRPPLDLQALLPTVDELNTCTAKWQAWEDLVHRKAAGESVTATEVAAALEAAQLYDGAVLGKYESAYAAYQKDYQAVVAESLPPVLMLLQGYFGDKVRWPHQKSQMLVASLKSVDLPALFDIPGVQRVSCNPEFGPMLDVSRLDIRADLVHAGQGGVGPYTGAGVKVAIVDNGVRAGHPRLPTVAEYDQCDFTKDPAEIGEGDDECCVAHGSWVAGVVFCKYDSRDAYRGIASEGPAGPSAPGATLVNARVQRKWSTLCGLTFSETWAGVDYPALHWCAAINAGAGARVINFSRGAPLVSQGFTTRADDLTALNVDSLVDTFGVCVVHSCGNAQSTPSLSPPSGAFNLFSIGGYDDGGSPVRTDNVIWAGTSPGPTADPNPRRKPDLCAPAVSIITTEQLAGFTLPPGGRDRNQLCRAACGRGLRVVARRPP